MEKAAPGHGYSNDYADGFSDGYVEYLFGGGTGEPPPVPQRHYWNGRYQTLEGQQAIDHWFAGCRQGASAGQENI
jgi:hypothetical protein